MMTAAASNDWMGCVLILSNPLGEEEKNLTDKIEKMWKKAGCEIFEGKVHSDLPGQDVLSLFDALATTDSSSYQYLVVVVMCNGGLLQTKDQEWQTYIEAKHGDLVKEEEFISKFYNNNITWREKPKIFVLGYNRMSNLKSRIRIDKALKQNSINPKENTSLNESCHTSNNYSMFSNMLLLYGSASDLIKEVYNVFSSRYAKDTFTQMLTTVNRKMRNNGRWSVFESTMTFPCSLFPHPNQHSGDNSSPSVGDANTVEETLSKTETLRKSNKELTTSEIAKYFLSNLPQDMTVAKAKNAFSQHSKTPLKGRGVAISNCLQEGNTCHEIDIRHMENLWKSTLGCEFESKTNMKACCMKTTLSDLSMSDPQDCDYLVVAVSAHGGLRQLGNILRPVCYGVDLEPVCEREILSYFGNKKSRWSNVVKIFIFDYCRGGNQNLRIAKAEPYVDENYDEDIFHPGTLPLINNCVVLYATYHDFVAYANDLIPTLDRVLSKNWQQKSLIEMLEMVNASMRDSQPHQQKAMSVFKSTLGAEFYLYKQEEIEGKTCSDPEQGAGSRSRSKERNSPSWRKERKLRSLSKKREHHSKKRDPQTWSKNQDPWSWIFGKEIKSRGKNRMPRSRNKR